jgi:putative sterol carrier protein
VRYLSLEWIDALTHAVAGDEAMGEAARHHSIAVTQVVTDTPEGEVTYHLSVGAGLARFAAGPAEVEDVRMVQDWDTAVGVATGTVNAQEAFITGRIRLFGDQQKLMEAHPVFRALDAVFADVRGRTTYE